jgi:hypothetical protein
MGKQSATTVVHVAGVDPFDLAEATKRRGTGQWLGSR